MRARGPDARVFHFGSANELRRRKLLYFTLINPSFSSAPGKGSMVETLRLHVHDIPPPQRC